MGWKLHDHSARAMQMIKDLDTNEWMQHDWVKPSVAQAIEHRHEMVFHGGNAPIWHTGHYQLAAKLGDGISLYFRLLSYLGWLFMLMMIVALPSLGLNLAGSRIEEDEVDPLGLAYTTIGNLGFSDGEHADVGRARSACLAVALTLYALSTTHPRPYTRVATPQPTLSMGFTARASWTTATTSRMSCSLGSPSSCECRVHHHASCLFCWLTHTVLSCSTLRSLAAPTQHSTPRCWTC